jgi:hypothetical protein
VLYNNIPQTRKGNPMNRFAAVVLHLKELIEQKK